MAFQDSDPERRNLMVTSTAFIAYFYAGGSFPETSVRLQVINAEFSNPVALAIIAWIAFIWFAYRYWLKHSGNFTANFQSELKEWCSKKCMNKYTNKHFNQTEEYDDEGFYEGYYASSIYWHNYCVNLSCQHASFKRNPDGKVTQTRSTSSRTGEQLNLTDLKGWLLAIRVTISCMIKKPSFSSFAVPYILTLVALAGAAYRYCF